jgi:putative phage-type endonuclease
MTINRSKYLGGSDAAAILGLDRYRSPHDVYLDKIGEGTPRQDNEAMLWGRNLEAIVRKEYIRRTGRRVRPGVVRHLDHPFIRGHVDGRGDALLEVKVARDDRDWGEDGDSSITAIPAYYRPQLAHYLIASGKSTIDVAALIRGQELRIYPDIPKPAWADALLAEEVRFWNENVLERIPPELDGSDGAGRMLRKQFPVDDGSELIALPEQYELLEAYRLARLNAEQAEVAEARIAQAIQKAMGNASYLLAPGVRISWKKAKDGVTVDWKRYAESLEKVVDDNLVRKLAVDLDTLKSLYTSPREGSRRWLPKFDDPQIEEGVTP